MATASNTYPSPLTPNSHPISPRSYPLIPLETWPSTNQRWKMR